jgi:hypothetical protein
MDDVRVATNSSNRNIGKYQAAPAPPPMLGSEMLSTNADIPGHRVVKSLGMARGLSVRSRSALGNLAVGVVFRIVADEVEIGGYPQASDG